MRIYFDKGCAERRKICLAIIFILSFGKNFTVAGQSFARQDPQFNLEKNNFLRSLRSLSADSTVSYPVIRNIEFQLNTTLSLTDHNKKLNATEREKFRKSMVYFIQEANRYLARKKMNLYELSNAVGEFKKVTTALIQNQANVEWNAITVPGMGGGTQHQQQISQLWLGQYR